MLDSGVVIFVFYLKKKRFWLRVLRVLRVLRSIHQI